MKRRQFSLALATIACVGMIVPPTTLAADNPQAASPASLARDVALRPGGLLVGQVVDAQGAVQAGQVVSIRCDDQEVVRTTTDANGVYAARGLRGGQYTIAAQDGIALCRLWAPDTAPPVAHEAAIVVTGQEVVRGQWGGGFGGGNSWLNWIRSHPYITAGIVAAAVAVPVAVVADDDSNS